MKITACLTLEPTWSCPCMHSWRRSQKGWLSAAGGQRRVFVAKLDPTTVHQSSSESGAPRAHAGVPTSALHQHASNRCRCMLAVCVCCRCRICSLALAGALPVSCNGGKICKRFSGANHDRCNSSCTFCLHRHGLYLRVPNVVVCPHRTSTSKWNASCFFLGPSRSIMDFYYSSRFDARCDLHIPPACCWQWHGRDPCSSEGGFGLRRHVHAHVQLPQVSTHDARMDEVVSQRRRWIGWHASSGWKARPSHCTT